MELKGLSTRAPATTGEPLVTFWQSGQGQDLDALQIFEDGLLIHTSTQQKRRSYRRAYTPFASLGAVERFGKTLFLVGIPQEEGTSATVRNVVLSDEKTAEVLRELIALGMAAAEAEGRESERALEDLRERAEEARKIYGEETEVSVRKITVPSYDPSSRRERIVGRFPLQEGEPLRLDVAFVMSEIRRRYASVSDYERVMGNRPTFRAYWNLPAGEGEKNEDEQGGYAELGYRPEDDALLLQLHNGFEDELSPTTEDHVSELLREAAGQSVYLESL